MSGKVQFKRNYAMVVGPRNPSNPASKGVLINGLRVVFSVSKSLEQQPNVATFEVYNLAKTTRAKIEDTVATILKTAQGQQLVNIPTIIMNVGYGEELKTIFIGDVAQITTRKDGTDVVTSFDMGDGQASYADAKLDISFAPGTKFQQVLDALRQKMGLTLGQVVGVNPADQFLNGVSLTGPARNSLEKVLAKQNLGWSIQDNALQILPADTATPETAVLINRSTGLIGTPFKTKVLNDTLLQQKDSKSMKSGLQCVVLLNPSIKPGRLIKIESETVTGQFKVTKLRHYGDTHGQQWYTEIVAE